MRDEQVVRHLVLNCPPGMVRNHRCIPTACTIHDSVLSSTKRTTTTHKVESLGLKLNVREDLCEKRIVSNGCYAW